jgi:putative transposase
MSEAKYHAWMVRYRRNRVQGATYFFTVTLAERRSTALVDHIGALRAAFRVTRQERPFTIDAVVILPDHLHAILSLPEGDADFAGRWRRIKGHFSTPTACCGDRYQASRKWRTCTLAKTLLGTHHP